MTLRMAPRGGDFIAKNSCTMNDAIHEPIPASAAQWLTSDCTFARKMVCIPRPRAPC